MKKYFVTVYAICKNEEKFVDRWVESMQEADKIVVLDTGSTDKTVEKLKKYNIEVTTKIITPWRFDTARNESLKLIPKQTDICVCTDLDEVFEKGWREKLENSWQDNTTQLKYTYIWNHLENGKDGTTFLYEKIHCLEGFKWIYPVHEVLSFNCSKKEQIAINKNIVLRHFADPQKSRGQYLKLLELSVKENPLNDRNTHYLGREYMFYKKYKEAIQTLKHHLRLKTAVWLDERSASCRFIADCYLAQNKPKQALFYYKKAIAECPYTRESYLSLATYYYNKQDYTMCLITLQAMLQIKEKSLTYITQENCWNELPYDMLSFCYYKLNKLELAKKYCLIAFNINPSDKHLQYNLKFYNSIIK